MERSIISYNADNRHENTTNIIKTLNILKPIAALIQDIPLTADIQRIIQTYAKEYTIASKLDNTNRDTTTLIHKDQIIEHNEHLTNKHGNKECEITQIRIKKDNNSTQIINLVNLYIRPRADIQETQNVLEQTMTKLKHISIARSIIMGDTNAISIEWTPTDNIINSYMNTDINDKTYNNIQLNRGRLINNILTKYKIKCINDITQGPTYATNKNNQNSESYIDIAAMGNKTIRSWKRFEIIKTKWTTQHRIIKITQTKELTTTNSITSHQNMEPKRKRKESELTNNSQDLYKNLASKYKQEINGSWIMGNKTETITKMNKITTDLYTILKQTQTKRKTKKKYNNNKPTPNKKLKRHKQLLRLKYRLKRAKNKNKINKRIHNIINSEEAYNRMDKIEDPTVWQKTNIIDTILYNDKLQTNNKQARQQNTIELEKIAKQKFPYINRDEAIKLIKQDKENDKPILRLINQSEIKRALIETKRKMYTGPEGIRFNTLTKASEDENIERIILTICQMSIATAELPTNTRTSLGKIIPKKNPGQYRIVHMSSPIAAVIEQVILHRLEYELETKRQYSNIQYGFIALRGRHDLITRLIDNILRNKFENKQNKRSTIVSLDIQGAFDNVNHNIIIHKIYNILGKNNIITKWIANFLLNKSIILEYDNNRTEPRNICQGVPQGSSLGPILWNLMINDIDQNGIIDKRNMELLAYADDLILVDHNNDDKTVNRTLTKLTQRLETLGLRISAEKSQVMYIENTEGNVKRISTIEIEGTRVPLVKDMSILGIRIKRNHLKLDLKSITTNTKLKQNIYKLKRYKELGSITDTKEWQTLADAYIKSIIIINNFPILAIDIEARKTVDRIMARIYKCIFDWPKNTSDKLTRLVLNQKSCKLTVKELITNRLHTEHGQYYNTLKNILNHDIDISNIALAKTQWHLTQNKTYTKKAKRRYANPETTMPIKITKEINNSNWTIIALNRKAFMINIKENAIQPIEHMEYPIPYFNMMTAIRELVRQDMEKTINNNNNNTHKNRTILLNENEAITKAIQNMNNHDERIIETREILAENNWEIRLTQNRNINNLTNHIKKILKQQTQMQSIKSKDPDIKDYRLNNDNRARLNTEYTIEMNNNMTTVCKELHNNVKEWQTINPGWVTGKTMLALSGLNKDDKGQLNNGKQLTCPCNQLTNQTHITVHRIKECTLTKNINILNSEQEANIDMIRQEPNTIRDMLKSKQQQQKLLKLIRDIAL